jgi:hypothetical protein
MTVLFLDPTTIKFDKKLGAWTCWCRVIETKDRFEWKVQTAFRNEGQEEATIGFAKYKFPGGIFISQSTRTAKEMQWEQTIPDTSVEALWKIIKAHIVAHSTPKKK